LASSDARPAGIWHSQPLPVVCRDAGRLARLRRTVTTFAPLVNRLAERLRRREVSRLAYFHTDHFEPWRALGKALAIGPESVQAVHDFCRATQGVDFARRLTLFYKPYVGYALRRGDGLLRAAPEDLVGFRPRTERQEHFGRQAMQEVAATTRHVDPAAKAWFASPAGRGLDEARLDLAIRLSREAIARETGRAAERWFFVHGQWALNASDHRSCTITNEIEILARNGCAGDFTFPADYAHVDPRLKVPYFCRPLDEAKGYDRPEAEPEIACGNRLAARSKFFIWASPATARQCSLDYMFEPVRRHLENVEKAALQLVETAYIGDRRLYIKTHAHSMNAAYFQAGVPLFPHLYPAIRNILGSIFEAADRAGITVELPTVPEVYDTLVSAPEQPDVDLAAVYRQPREVLRAGVLRLLRPMRSR
jgi:hypothetical protein